MDREEKLKKIIEEIKNDEENKKYTEQGIDPLFSAPKEARIVIVGAEKSGSIPCSVYFLFSSSFLISSIIFLSFSSLSITNS